MGKADHADGGGKKQEQPAGGFGTTGAPTEPCDGERGEKSSKGARESRSGFADAEKPEAKSGAPVIKDRFFEPWLTVEARRDPISGLYHVPSDPGVTWLIRSDEADGTEVVEIANVKCGED